MANATTKRVPLLKFIYFCSIQFNLQHALIHQPHEIKKKLSRFWRKSQLFTAITKELVQYCYCIACGGHNWLFACGPTEHVPCTLSVCLSWAIDDHGLVDTHVFMLNKIHLNTKLNYFEWLQGTLANRNFKSLTSLLCGNVCERGVEFRKSIRKIIYLIYFRLSFRRLCRIFIRVSLCLMIRIIDMRMG